MNDMSNIALFSGIAAFIAGLTKFGMDVYRARHTPPRVTISVGNECIQLPSSYTPDQVAAIVAVLKENASMGHATE